MSYAQCPARPARWTLTAPQIIGSANSLRKNVPPSPATPADLGDVFPQILTPKRYIHRRAPDEYHTNAAMT